MNTARHADRQDGWLGKVDSALGRDVLLLESMRGREALSELFDFRLCLRSARRDVDPAAMIGSAMTLRVQRRGGAPRFFHGVVTFFSCQGADARNAWYEARLQPGMCAMASGRDRRIFQDMSAPDIVLALLREQGVVVSSRLAAGDYPVREYCVQFDESGFDFVSRLMEEEGIFYFFEFSERGHLLVLADAPSAHPDCEQAPVLTYARQDPGRAAISRFEAARHIEAPAPVLADHDDLNANGLHTGGGPGRRFYRYPGKYQKPADGKRKADILAAALRVQSVAVSAESECEHLRAGVRFRLQGHPDARHDQSYVVKAVEHDLHQGAYGNRIEAFPESLAFRPLPSTPWPKVSGEHTAVVAGPPGEEIWTDDHGRVKVKFHWDDGPGANEQASCWMRVSQPLAGQGWGAWFLPRVGQEVVVAYVDGDPDRPMVVGTVYNLKQGLPLDLPAQQAQTLLRSRSTRQGQAGNELRMDDRSGEEELYLRAQKDMKVEVQALLSTLAGQGETHCIEKGDRLVRVAEGNERHEVQGSREVRVSGDEAHVNAARFRRDVSGDCVLTVSGNLTIDVRGGLTIKTMGGYSLESAATVSVKGLSIEQSATATQTLDGGGLLRVKGGLVKVN